MFLPKGCVYLAQLQNTVAQGPTTSMAALSSIPFEADPPTPRPFTYSEKIR